MSSDVCSRFLFNPGLDSNRPLIKVGVYGWRKQCLYMLVCLLSVLVFINFALTLWLMLLLKPSYVGFGPMKIQNNGISVKGNVEVSKAIKAKEIWSEHSLDISSNDGITMRIANKNLTHLPLLALNKNGLHFQGKKFEIRNSMNNPVFTSDDNGVNFHGMKIELDTSGAIQKLRTEVINSVGKSLTLAAGLNGAVKIQAPRKISVSNTEVIELISKNLTYIHAQNLKIKATDLFMPKLPIYSKPLDKVDRESRAYFVCSCPNGRIFGASDCRASYYVCRTRSLT